MSIKQHVIPEGTGVQISTYACTFRTLSTGAYLTTRTVQRDPRYFAPYADAFWPERWVPEGRELAAKQGREFVLNAAAYAPFSIGSSESLRAKSRLSIYTGPHNCAGRSIAYLEMRDALAELVRRFDIALAEGMTKELWQASVKDKFTLATGPLWVTLQQRS